MNFRSIALNGIGDGVRFGPFTELLSPHDLEPSVLITTVNGRQVTLADSSGDIPACRLVGGTSDRLWLRKQGTL